VKITVYIIKNIGYTDNITNGVYIMNVNEAMSMAAQLETLVDMSKLFNSSRDQLCESILLVAKNLKDMADQMDLEMSAFAEEQYQDEIVTTSMVAEYLAQGVH